MKGLEGWRGWVNKNVKRTGWGKLKAEQGHNFWREERGAGAGGDGVQTRENVPKDEERLRSNVLPAFIQGWSFIRPPKKHLRKMLFSFFLQTGKRRFVYKRKKTSVRGKTGHKSARNFPTSFSAQYTECHWVCVACALGTTLHKRSSVQSP